MLNNHGGGVDGGHQQKRNGNPRDLRPRVSRDRVRDRISRIAGAGNIEGPVVSKQWVEFFRHEAEGYLGNEFTRNTVAEVDFIERELHPERGDSFVDIGCGTGRHTLELARRGYRCTGIDQSGEMLSRAVAAAETGKVQAEFVQADAAEVVLDRRFDHAICLCEGAFSLVEHDADSFEFHRSILSNIFRMLKPRGMFLLTALSAFRMIRSISADDVASGRFDVMTQTLTEEVQTSDGTRVTVSQKGFTPAELTTLLDRAGFESLAVWGGTAGAWNKRPLELDEIELMVLSRRPG